MPSFGVTWGGNVHRSGNDVWARSTLQVAASIGIGRNVSCGDPALVSAATSIEIVNSTVVFSFGHSV